jgi:hypothetical protein
MTTYSRSLHFGAIESIDERSIRVAVREKKLTPLISMKLKVSRRKKELPPMELHEKVCKEIVRIAEMEEKL